MKLYELIYGVRKFKVFTKAENYEAAKKYFKYFYPFDKNHFKISEVISQSKTKSKKVSKKPKNN